jgi:hypothetical protein
MKADILKASGPVNSNPETPDEGEWVITHDPDSNEIIRVWQGPEDNPDTPQDETTPLKSFRCEARAIVDGGIRVAGTTERLGDLYQGVDFVRITFPPNTDLNRRDRVTNIRGANGKVIWIEEERTDGAPTVFSVTGIAPILDPFGRHIESMALLERVEGQ